MGLNYEALFYGELERVKRKQKHCVVARALSQPNTPTSWLVYKDVSAEGSLLSKTAVVHGGTERGILKKIKRSLLKKMSVADINEATTNAKARTIQALEAKEQGN